jgi:hypothetical protein
VVDCLLRELPSRAGYRYINTQMYLFLFYNDFCALWMCRKADDMFTDVEVWKNVHDRDRRELFDDVVHLIAKREKVSCLSHADTF